MIGKKHIKCICQLKSEYLCTKCNTKLNSISIIALSRIGLQTPEEKYLKVLDKIMQFESFKGIIGRKPQKALYFLGRHNHDYIYLDPHFVQSA